MTDINIDNQIRTFIDAQFPDFARQNGPKLVSFIKKYYEWMETANNTNANLAAIKSYFDVDTAPEKFFRFLRDEFLQNIPDTIVVDDKILIKHIQDFYRARGSEKSFRLLFRILFNEEIEFYYPARDILRVSDGKWYIEKEITLDSHITPAQTFSYLTKEIYGRESKARGRVDRIYSYTDNARDYYIMIYSALSGNFIEGEYITAKDRESIIGKIDVLTIKPGRYLNTDGFLSADKRIQDRDYYQEYSYVVRSGQPSKNFDTIVDSLVHPSGTKRFNDFYLFRTLDVDISQSIAPVDLEFEITYPLIVELLSDIALGGEGNALEILQEYFFQITTDIEAKENVWEYMPQDVGIQQTDTIDALKQYTVGDLYRVNIEDPRNKYLVLGLKEGNTEFLTDIANNETIVLYDKLNNDNEYSFIDVKDVVSDVAIITKLPYIANTSLIN